MTHNLRDQLLGLGFKPAPKPERAPETAPGRPRSAGHVSTGARSAGKPADIRSNSPPGVKPGAADRPRSQLPARDGSTGKQRPRNTGGSPRSQVDIDLAKAYAIRAHREKDERIAAEQARQEEARLRREARARVTALVEGKGLNAADAEIARHFPYGGKIKRIYVTPAQLKALNAGELGVLQMDGRYLLVTAELLSQAESLFPPAVALKVDPDAPAADDPYADLQYQVPDDLVW